ncbi:hypothetical protein ACHQM5_014697 [Ranunculus cassubicifolius]
MEGLIPIMYRAIVEYKRGGGTVIGSTGNESPSSSYMRLAGDSGRLQGSEVQMLLRHDQVFTHSTVSQPQSPHHLVTRFHGQSQGVS